VGLAPTGKRRLFTAHAEVDLYWERLGEGGKPGQCGWLTDKFGVSWQIVPSVVPRILQSGDAAGIQRVMRAIMPMKKLDVAKIQQVFGPN
jgi:predicted 3-demethylubiquinone-9 3-methyltransferase (glyoxalase superfamily)